MVSAPSGDESFSVFCAVERRRLRGGRAGRDVRDRRSRTSGGPPARDLWFVLIADDGLGAESSWGLATEGERNGATASGTCGSTVKDLSETCP